MLAPESLGLVAAVLALGFKHGFDADHLAAIDATSRLNRQAGRERAARWSGAQFSLGHSLLVLLIAQLSYHAGGVVLPDWLDATGAWLSIACLTLVGLLSIRTAGQTVQRGHALPRWLRPLAPLTVSRWGAAVTGALFALSLDTLTMATWFAGSAARLGGAGTVLLLGAAFGAGMLMADGVAGWWVNRLAGAAALQRERGRRYAGWLIGLGALVTAALGVARQIATPLDEWADGHALPLGLALLAATTVLLLLAGRRAAPRASQR
ncbi:MAG TPA: nickel transporter [Burkholderiaceae bacterium]|jgi:high-affinity nickel-transport protein|nr:nickel transporter [Burkholderiaceae bacterium]